MLIEEHANYYCKQKTVTENCYSSEKSEPLMSRDTISLIWPPEMNPILLYVTLNVCILQKTGKEMST